MKIKIMYLVLASLAVINLIAVNLLESGELTLVNMGKIQQVSAEATGEKQVNRVTTSEPPVASTAICPNGTKQACITTNSKCVITCPSGGQKACTPEVVLTTVTTCSPSCRDKS